MEYLKSLHSLISKYQMALGCSALSLMAAVGENLFSSEVFKCPCNDWNHEYGLVFLLVPALLLFLLGIMLNTALWKHSNQRMLSFYILLQVTFYSAFPPLICIALSLLKVHFYECIVSGIPLDYLKDRYCGNNKVCTKELLFIPCVSSLKLNLSKDDMLKIRSNIQAESQQPWPPHQVTGRQCTGAQALFKLRCKSECEVVVRLSGDVLVISEASIKVLGQDFYTVFFGL
ncbi:hypothetical protein GDO81_029137 [Engystomops pustulosus]|uniref:Uncharacterized protein n=1 Tax=Engystomops pustulosus TaxID=76066 RepID=A0AAV6Z666_ENGPU|nr:hypothetical protein GDO81_029137 [Engystomops pustulosus]